MAKSTYFNYMNLPSYLNQLGLRYDGQYLRWLKDIISTKISMFSYDGFPKETKITSQILETALMFNNFLCFYRSKALGGLVLCRYIFGGEFDQYWKPVKVNLLTLSGKSIATDVPYEDIIPIRDNDMDIIPFLTLTSYIDQIIDFEDTLKMNMQLLRLPTLFTGSKSQVAQLKQMIKKVTDKEPFAIADKDFSEAIQPVKFDLPVNPSSMYEIMEKYRNLALASMGIYGVDKKRERLVTSEIHAENDLVDFIYQSMLEQRKVAIDKLREWGYDITIKESYVENMKDETELEVEKSNMIEDGKAKAQEKIKEKEVIEDE